MLETELDQCQERDLRRTTEAHRWTIDANPARRIDRHSCGKVEALHESPAALRRSNRASERQPDLTSVTVSGELQQGPIAGPLGRPSRARARVQSRARSTVGSQTHAAGQVNRAGHRRYRRSKARRYHRRRALIHCGAPGCHVSPTRLSSAPRRWHNRDCPERPVSQTASRLRRSQARRRHPGCAEAIRRRSRRRRGEGRASAASRSARARSISGGRSTDPRCVSAMKPMRSRGGVCTPSGTRISTRSSTGRYGASCRARQPTLATAATAPVAITALMRAAFVLRESTVPRKPPTVMRSRLDGRQSQ